MGFTLNQLEQERQIRKLQKKEDKDTKDYEQLSHLPKINNVELKGNKTSGDLGLSSDADIATDFSENTNYTAGCYVYYEGTLYRFNADHSAGAWDPTDVVTANVTDEIVSNAAAIAGLEDALSSVTHFYKPTEQYTTDNTGVFNVNTGLNLTGKSVFVLSNIADALERPYHATINKVTNDGVVSVRIRNLQDNTAVVNTQIYGTHIMIVIA